MGLAPAEIRHRELHRGLFGYRQSAVDDLLDEVVESFEQVWRERADLSDRAEQLETDLHRYRELETLLRSTLVSAERAAQELKENARREAELIVDEAHAEARAVTRTAAGERERLLGEANRVRALLQAALETVSGAAENGRLSEAEAA
jgi:cell division initiation protein